MEKPRPEISGKSAGAPHNGTDFKVVAELKNKVYQMQDMGSERKFKMSSKDALFTELLEARNNSQEISSGIDNTVVEEFDREIDAVEEYISDNIQMER